MSTFYDLLTESYPVDSTSNHAINYVDGATVSYPESNITTVMGPLWLPRIYGKDLTALEIASSGKIAITLNDIHSFDLNNQSNYGGVSNQMVATLNTRSNYAMQLSTNDGSNYMTLDAYTNEATLLAPSNVTVQSTEKNVVLQAGSNIDMTACNLNFNGDVAFNSENFTVAASNVSLSATSNMLVSGESNVTISANNDNMTITMDSVTSNLAIYSSSNVSVSADVNTSLSATETLSTDAKTITETAASNYEVTAGSNVSLSGATNTIISATTGMIDIGTDSGSVSLVLDEATSNMSGYATNDISLVSENNTVVSASNNLTASAVNDASVTAETGSVTLSASANTLGLTLDQTTSNVSLFSDAGEVSAAAGTNLLLSALNDATLTASNNTKVFGESNVVVETNQGDITLLTSGSNVFVNLDHTGSNLSGFAALNVALESGSNTTLLATENLTASASNGSFSASAKNSTMLMTMDATTDTLSLTASNGDLALYSGSNFTTISIMDTVISSSNDVDVFATSNLTLTADSGLMELTAVNSSLKITLDDTTSNMTLYSTNDIISEAGSNFSVVTGADFVVASSNNASVSAVNAVTVAASNIAAVAESNLDLTASNSLSVYGETDVSLETTTGFLDFRVNTSNVFLTLDNATSNMTGYAANEINFLAESNLVLNTSNTFNLTAAGAATVTADSASLDIAKNLTATASNVTLSSDNVLALETLSNNMVLTSASNFTVDANDNLELFAKDSGMSFTMLSTEGTINVNSSNDINFRTHASVDPVFVISSNDIRITGNLIIDGEISTSNVTQTNIVVNQETLRVADKTIQLANVGDSSSPDGMPFDGADTNSGAGIIIDGVPETVTDSNLWDNYEKSIKWNYGTNGLLDVGTSNIASESYWEILGGAMHITHKKNYAGTFRDLTFGFRINEQEELELIKKFWDTNTASYVFRRVAKFGRHF